MAKRSQQDSGEERVTAKSKPTMNLIARTPSFVSSSTSVSLGKRFYGKQDPWRSVFAKDRPGQPGKETESFSSTDYAKLDYDRAWSSQEWKAEATTHDRSGRPDKASWRMLQHVRPHHGETLLDGTAQSVRYGEPLRDRSRQPDNVNSQEAANSQNFIMGIQQNWNSHEWKNMIIRLQALGDQCGVCVGVQAEGYLMEKQIARTMLDYHNVQTNGQKLNCLENEQIFFKHKVNVWIWLFMSTTLKAAVDLGHYQTITTTLPHLPVVQSLQ